MSHGRRCVPAKGRPPHARRRGYTAYIACSSPSNGNPFSVSTSEATVFSQRISLLLKHDWERVKLEAGSAIMRVKVVREWVNRCLYQPKREEYRGPG